jgi:hypothetical protein
MPTVYLAADTVDRSTVVQQPTDLVDIPPQKVLKLRKGNLNLLPAFGSQSN